MKKVLSLMLIIACLLSCNIKTQAKESTPHFILIYMDQNYEEGDFKAMQKAGITEYIIVSLNNYDHNIENYMDQLIPRTFYTLLKITEEVPDAHIWVATPHMTSMTKPYYFETALPKVYDYILEIKNCFPNIWEKNIKGIYMNTEAIIGDVDYQDITSNFSISFMNDLSYRIHEYLDKEFLWIPYYGYGDNAADVIKKLGYVANTTPIFDYILIQPHYYFDGTTLKNFDGIFKSITSQEIHYRDKVTVVPRTEVATATIGFLVEMSYAIQFTDETIYRSRYEMYNFYFKGIRNKFPSGFYAGGALEIDFDRIHNFYIKNYQTEVILDLLQHSDFSLLY